MRRCVVAGVVVVSALGSVVAPSSAHTVRAVAPSAPLAALTGSNTIVRFDASTPATITSTVGITGLQSAELVVGFDVRPATGELMAIGIVGTTGRLYRLDVATGAATLIGATPF